MDAAQPPEAPAAAAPAAPPVPGTIRDPRALSTEYHKARKQLMLWAAILFIWELVGIDLDKAKEVGGNAGAIISAIKSPQAVPWVLLILVGYFLFKCTVEWYQCSLARRALRVSRVDFTSAWIVPLLAYVLYAYQAMSRVQFADVVTTSDKTRSVSYGLMGGMVFSVCLLMAWRQYLVRQSDAVSKVAVLLSLIMLLMTVGLSIRFRHSLSWPLLVIGMLGGILPLTLVALIMHPWRIWRSLGRANSE